ncbi:radical SAM protein [Paraburkholderia bannensis]|uniref:radical SAM protein n=1 Tax=Paraburkholderia bannensis TaxID=765414 RepID=UPI002AB6DA5C|nr:radical SAM protein [Paraburkholderia bannensis]
MNDSPTGRPFDPSAAEVDVAATASAFRIPVVTVQRAFAGLPPSHSTQRANLHARLGLLFDQAVLREPPPDDESRWIRHTLSGREVMLSQPLTFTPYASVMPCSARCRFCSETLVESTMDGPMGAALRPGVDYFNGLRRALEALRDIPLSYSLSGLESTDDPDWLMKLLETLACPAGSGPRIEGSVLYTNGAGFADHAGRLLPELQAFGLRSIEWSRHHDHDEANQAIMRFRDHERIAGQATFVTALQRVNGQIPVKLVCVLQRGGIETPTDIQRYTNWAASLGVRTVIFREFSSLPAQYRANVTRRYIDHARVSASNLLASCLDTSWFLDAHVPLALTRGYYFWNARWIRGDGLEVVFEASDYDEMRQQEDTGRIYKLVYFANGNLCAGWQPERQVLWSARANE